MRWRWNKEPNDWPCLRAKNSAFSSEEIWKGVFSFRTAIGVKSCADLLAKAPGGPVKSIEQNLWTVVSRKADPADFREKCRSPVKERNLRSKPFEKDKYILKLFFLLPFLNIGNYIYIFRKGKKETEKICFVHRK